MTVISAAPAGFPALVLNADYRPLSYYPLSLWPWQEAVKAVFLDRVEVVAEYEQPMPRMATLSLIPRAIAGLLGGGGRVSDYHINAFFAGSAPLRGAFPAMNQTGAAFQK